MGETPVPKAMYVCASTCTPRGFVLSKCALSENFAVGWMSIPQNRVRLGWLQTFPAPRGGCGEVMVSPPKTRQRARSMSSPWALAAATKLTEGAGAAPAVTRGESEDFRPFPADFAGHC